MTTPHNATLFTNPAQSTPAETKAEIAAQVTASQGSYESSADSSVEQYQLLTGRRPGPDPVITTLDPYEVEVSATPTNVTVTVEGENFYEDWSVVVWNGTAVETTFVSATELEITVAVPDTVGIVGAYVTNSVVSHSAVVTFDFIAETP